MTTSPDADPDMVILKTAQRAALVSISASDMYAETPALN